MNLDMTGFDGRQVGLTISNNHPIRVKDFEKARKNAKYFSAFGFKRYYQRCYVGGFWPVLRIVSWKLSDKGKQDLICDHRFQDDQTYYNDLLRRYYTWWDLRQKPYGGYSQKQLDQQGRGSTESPFHPYRLGSTVAPIVSKTRANTTILLVGGVVGTYFLLGWLDKDKNKPGIQPVRKDPNRWPPEKGQFKLG